MKEYRPYLHHILEEIDYLLSRTRHLHFPEFAKDETLKRAFVRSLEVIGEAVKNIPDPIKTQYPEIPWRQMAGMRDKLIHFYFGVNYQLVWEAIQGELPRLRDNIQSILMSSSEGSSMQKRRLGNSDLELTVIGLGTWAIGGSWEYGWGPQEDADSIATIRAALEQGINWIDTAPAYGCGHSEEVIGQALKGLQRKPLLATKCGLGWDSQRRKVNCLDRKAILAECDASLKRLGADVIDLYQLHWPVPDNQLEEAWEAMATVQRQGKVRYLGASNFTTAQLDRVAKIHPPVSMQPPYSMLQRGAEEEMFGYCTRHKMGIVAYSPMQKGLLTGKYNPQTVAQMAPDDHRHRDPNFHGARLAANMRLIEQLRPIAERNGRTLSHLAIAWVLRRPEVTAAIVGARKPSQINETVGAGDWVLKADEIDEIEQYLAECK
jgi:aryl-alcohol dehydrogenase-like predicted oxidoreductase/uncharacterized protein with HEPN domain